MYEVRYKLQDLSQYDPVQKRKRVPIMAAGFGVQAPYAQNTYYNRTQKGNASLTLPKAHT